MRRAAAARDRVERRIYFYRMNAGTDEAGRPIRVDLTPAVRHINGLQFDPAGRYLESEDTNVTCCWIDSQRVPQRLRVANVRRSGLPQVERAGRLSALNIPPESGLVEQVHVVFFPDGIAGAEFNFYGPRLSRLSGYLLVKARDLCPQITFEPLLRQDVTEQLARLGDIRLFQLKILAPYAGIVAEADRDLGAAFQAAMRAGEADDVEIVLKPRAYSRGRLAGRLLATARRLARRPDLRESASRFVVKGLNRETEEVDIVDVLSDQLISRKQIVLEDPRTRALNRASAYSAIVEAHGELREELRAAAAALEE